jgi:imidazole glycerol-phosphate synthase subunit HisF
VGAYYLDSSKSPIEVLKTRVIPVLLLKNGYLVQSKSFERHQKVGNASWCVKRLSEWGADELIYLDITRSGDHLLERSDLQHPTLRTLEEILSEVANYAFMPMTVGGGIRSIEDIEARLRLGADKVAVNSMLYTDSSLVNEATKIFGSQCIVASLDYHNVGGGKVHGYYNHGQTDSRIPVVELVKKIEDLGVGEILLNCINRDGMRTGYDIDIIKRVCEIVKVPVIALGGAGDHTHFCEVLDNTGVHAVAASNMFHYRDQSVYLDKKIMFELGYCVRMPELHHIS